MPEKVTYRVTRSGGFFLVLVAVIFDLVQFLLKFLWLTGVLAIVAEILDWALAILGYTILILSFLAIRVNPTKGVRGKARGIISMVCEAMPLLNGFLPGMTVWTILTVRRSRQEDRERAEENARMELEAARQRAIAQRAREERRQRDPQQPQMRRQLRSFSDARDAGAPRPAAPRRHLPEATGVLKRRQP